MASSKVGTAGSPALKRQLPSSVALGQPCWLCGNKCPGGYMPHNWRKKCITCGCDHHCHQEFNHYVELSYLKNIQFKDTLSTQNKAKLESKYSWYPREVEYDTVETYMSKLPDDFVPYKSSPRKRHEMFILQHPLQDGNVIYCHELPDLEKKRMVKFGERRIRKFFGVGKVSTTSKQDVCHGCSTTIKEGSVVVTAPDRVLNDKMWHPQCFRCYSCTELLVDLLYFYSTEKDEIYCGRHHAETIIPRCNGCDEVIVSGTFTEAKNEAWHKHHFTCSKCDKELHDKQYKLEKGTTYCGSCYTKYLAERCIVCMSAIAINQTKVTVDGKIMHKECFTCKRCQISIAGSEYFKQHNNSYLCKDCQARIMVGQCHGCKKGIQSTISYVKHKQFMWHAECFKCVICQAWLPDGSFHELDESIMCHQCFQQKNSRKCCRCQESILKRNVQLGLDYYHPECFTCRECNKSLLQEEKISSSEVICIDCKLKKAKKCTYCKCPITSRHTVYKGHQFHLECFKCNVCGSSIQGKEFYETSLNEIICNKCASLH